MTTVLTDRQLNEILLAQRAIIRECLLWDNGKLPIPQTRYRIEYELQRFASKPMCPWMYTRTLVHSPRFLELIHWFEAVLCQFLDKVNRNVAPAMVPVLGLDKQEFLGVISEVLCKNMVPVLYLKDSAIPKLEHILEKVDSLYDPVCLNPVEDEDEPLELGMARGLWKVALLTLVSSIVNTNPATELLLHREGRRHAYRQRHLGL